MEGPLIPGKRFRATQSEKLAVDCDLSRTGVEDAIEVHRKTGFAPRLLIVPEERAFDAGEIVCGLGLEVVILPKELMPDEDGWALASDHFVVWSPGA